MNTEFEWKSDAAEPSHAYLVPKVHQILQRKFGDRKDQSILDIGSGNGSMTEIFDEMGYNIIGVEPSYAGVEFSRNKYPHIHFEHGSGYDDLAGKFGKFDAVISCEVIEHLLTPGVYLTRMRDLLKEDSIAIISTPFHGYLKNILIAATGNWDHHHHPTREWGHVKFFSRATINELAQSSGLEEAEFPS